MQYTNVVVTGANDIDDVLVKGQCWVKHHFEQFDVVSKLHVCSGNTDTLYYEKDLKWDSDLNKGFYGQKLIYK